MDSSNVSKLADFLGISESELIKTLNHDPKNTDVKTYEQAKHLFESAPKGSELGKIAYDKMIEAGKKSTESISNFDQGRKFIATVPKNSELEKAVLIKLLSLAITIKQAREVYEKSDGLVRQSASEKITSIGTAMLFDAKNFDQARHVYKKAIKKSTLQHIALVKMLELASNIKQARIVFSKAHRNSELEKDSFAKILTFTVTVSDAAIAYNDVRRNNSLGIMALEKLTEIGSNIVNESKDLLQVRQVYDLAPKRSTLERTAAFKMLDLIALQH